ncbi:MAG: hypothetical protein AAGH87_03175 [Pseudomonadota bacterium]
MALPHSASVLLLLASAGLAACAGIQTGADTVQVTALPASAAAPVDAPVAYDETRLRRTGGAVYNRFGGEIPLGVPVQPIEERDLEDVTAERAG